MRLGPEWADFYHHPHDLRSPWKYTCGQLTSSKKSLSISVMDVIIFLQDLDYPVTP